MKPFLFLLVFFLAVMNADSQSYADSINRHFRDYTRQHEVVKGDDRQYLQFFPPDEAFRIPARLEAKPNSPWFAMETSGLIKKNYRVYGILHFTLHDTTINLPVYQSQDLLGVPQYKDYLFIPFTDATSGIESYSSGRYIDIRMDEIVNNQVWIDFNLAYNPYCAYVSGRYNCPIPPAENRLPVAVRAGEMAYGKRH